MSSISQNTHLCITFLKTYYLVKLLAKCAMFCIVSAHENGMVFELNIWQKKTKTKTKKKMILIVLMSFLSFFLFFCRRMYSTNYFPNPQNKGCSAFQKVKRHADNYFMGNINSQIKKYSIKHVPQLWIQLNRSYCNISQKLLKQIMRYKVS